MTTSPVPDLDTTMPADPSQPDREETMSRDELEALQLKRLQWSVWHAYENVPMYTKKFDDHGVHPSDLKELSDLARFPYTDKSDLREAYPFGAFAVPMDQVVRVHASSGTTGLPTVVGYTRGDLETWATLVARCLRLSGVRPGTVLQNSYGYGLFTGGLGAHAGAERLGCTVVPMSGGQTEKQIQLIQDFKPQTILCTPTYLLAIMDEMQRRGIDGRETSLKTAVLGAEPWTAEMRRELEEGLGINACDIYGLSEVMGPGVAGEAQETKDGSHIWEDHFRPEIINPIDDTQVLDDGHSGELVFTSLSKVAMPVIRYRTHDLTKLLPGTARAAHRRIGGITGRDDDMIILRGVNLFPTQIEEIALGIPGLSPHFQLELTRPSRMDELTVRVERRVDATAEICETAAGELRKQIKVKIGSSVKVEVLDPDALPRSTGKLKRIHDLRNA